MNGKDSGDTVIGKCIYCGEPNTMAHKCRRRGGILDGSGRDLDLDMDTETKKIPEDAKHQINQLLFQLLPDTATIGELERLACSIHFDIQKLWREKEMR